MERENYSSEHCDENTEKVGDPQRVIVREEGVVGTVKEKRLTHGTLKRWTHIK